MNSGQRSLEDFASSGNWVKVQDYLRSVGRFQVAAQIMRAADLEAAETISTLDTGFDFGLIVWEVGAQIVPHVVGVNKVQIPRLGASPSLNDILAKTGLIEVDAATEVRKYGLNEWFGNLPGPVEQSTQVDALPTGI